MYTFFKAAILSKKYDEYRNNFYTITLEMFWASTWNVDLENRIRESSEIYHLISWLRQGQSFLKWNLKIDATHLISIYNVELLDDKWVQISSPR